MALPKILIRPGLDSQGSGTTSTICYDNPYFVSALNQMFGIRGGEKITQIEIQDEGITARIDSDPNNDCRNMPGGPDPETVDIADFDEHGNPSWA